MVFRDKRAIWCYATREPKGDDRLLSGSMAFTKIGRSPRFSEIHEDLSGHGF